MPGDEQEHAEPRRPRESTATRAAIAAAARRLFAERGYQATTVRAVAAAAGINQNLITRYFGGKEGLFVAATAVRLDLAAVLAGPRATFGERLAASIVDRWTREHTDDPLLMLMRAAASRTEAAAALADFMRRESTEPLLAQMRAYGMTEAEARSRVSAIEALVMGTTVAHRIVSAPRSQVEYSALRTWLAPALQALVDLPGPSGARDVTISP